MSMLTYLLMNHMLAEYSLDRPVMWMLPMGIVLAAVGIVIAVVLVTGVIDEFMWKKLSKRMDDEVWICGYIWAMLWGFIETIPVGGGIYCAVQYLKYRDLYHYISLDYLTASGVLLAVAVCAGLSVHVNMITRRRIASQKSE